MRNKKIKVLTLTILATMIVSSTSVFAATNTSVSSTQNSTSTTVSSSTTESNTKSYVDSNGNLQPVHLTFNKKMNTSPIPPNGIKIAKGNIFMTAAYTAPYSIIYTAQGGTAEFLQQGCTGNWVTYLQGDLNSASLQYPNMGRINLTLDGIYGPATVNAVKQFQTFIKNGYGCSTMSIDGVAGYQTWTAIYALSDGDNPHWYIN